MGLPDGDRVLASMPVGFMAVSADWTITHLNPAAEPMLLVAAADLVGRNYWDAYPANRWDDSDFGRTFRHAMAERVTATVEAFYPDPLNRWYRVEAVPVDDGIFFYFSDVSERRVAQDRLAMLESIGAELGGTLDIDAAVSRIPQLVVPAWPTAACSPSSMPTAAPGTSAPGTGTRRRGRSSGGTRRSGSPTCRRRLRCCGHCATARRCRSAATRRWRPCPRGRRARSCSASGSATP